MNIQTVYLPFFLSHPQAISIIGYICDISIVICAQCKNRFDYYCHWILLASIGSCLPGYSYAHFKMQLNLRATCMILTQLLLCFRFQLYEFTYTKLSMSILQLAAAVSAPKKNLVMSDCCSTLSQSQLSAFVYNMNKNSAYNSLVAALFLNVSFTAFFSRYMSLHTQNFFLDNCIHRTCSII